MYCILCLALVLTLLWNGGVACPYYGVHSTTTAQTPNHQLHVRQPSATTGTSSRNATYDVRLHFDPEAAPLSPTIPRDFVGLSFEWTSAATLAKSSAFVKLVATLVRPAAAAGRAVIPETRPTTRSPPTTPLGVNLRVGGNSADRSRWNATTNGMNADALLALYHAAHAIGRHTTTDNNSTVTLLLDVTMRQPTSAAWAVEEWSGILETLGSLPHFNTLVEGIEIGNEADLFERHGMRHQNYTSHEYADEYGMYLTRLAKVHSLKHLVQGGTFCCEPDFMDSQVKFMKQFRPYLYSWSFHHYATTSCRGHVPTLASILSDAASERAATELEPYAAAAVDMGLAARMGETNTASCGGQPGVSDTMAAALWSLDYLFVLATHNISRVNFHGGTGGSYTWFALEKATGRLRQVNPLYYGMFVWNWLVANNPGTRVLPVECHGGQMCGVPRNSRTTNGSDRNSKVNNTHTIRVKTWAMGDNRTGHYKVVILNKLLVDEHSGKGKPITIELKAPFDRAELVVLKGPLERGMLATHNLSFAGWTWEGSHAGERKGRFHSKVLYPIGRNGTDNIFAFSQAPATALVVSFRR